MKKYKVIVNDIEQAGIDFGLEGSEETISGVIREVCEKVRDNLEDSLLDAVHLEAVCLVPFTDMIISEMEDFSLKSMSFTEAESLCETVRVKIERIGIDDEPWDKVINADTGEVIADKIHFNNVKGILCSGKVVADGVFEVLLKPFLKYNRKEKMFNDFFD